MAAGSRSKSLEKRVRELVDYDAITLALQDIALGRMPPGITSETTVKIRDRIEAAKLLYDRGHGKAKAVIQVADDVSTSGLASVDVDSLDEATLAILEAAVERALGHNVIDVGEAEVVDRATEIDDVLKQAKRK